MSAVSDRLIELKAELAAIRAARLKPLNGGQTYTLSGSHGVTYVTLKELEAEENRVVREIRSLIGPGKLRFIGVRYV